MHTKGPWKAGLTDSMRDTNIFTEDEQHYIGCASCEDVPYSERIDNANLIAAAPELLDALKDARQFIANGIEFGYIQEPLTGTKESLTLPKIDAALAKAHGKGV